MKKPIILLDVDGVCCDFVTPVVEAINRESGRSHQPEHVDRWDIKEALDVPHGIMESVNRVIEAPGFCRNLKPYPDAVAGVSALGEFADIYVVTSPWHSATWESERRAWVQEHLGISNDHVISTSAKHICSGDFLIDDKTSTLEKWVNCQSGHGILFERPWNKNDTWDGHLVDNWATLVKLVRILKELL